MSLKIHGNEIQQKFHAKAILYGILTNCIVEEEMGNIFTAFF